MDSPHLPGPSRPRKRKADDTDSSFFDNDNPLAPPKRCCSTPPRLQHARFRAHSPRSPRSPRRPPFPPLDSPLSTASGTQKQQPQPQPSDEQHVQQHDQQSVESPTVGPAPSSSSPLSSLNSSSVMSENEFTRSQALRGDDERRERQDKIDFARREILKNIALVRSLTFGGVADDATAQLLAGEIATKPKRGLPCSPEEMIAMEYLFPSSQSASRASSPVSPSYADAACSPRAASDGVQATPVKDPIKSDLELWQRELDGIRRPNPLVDPHGAKIVTVTVTTPLRQPPASTSASQSCRSPSRSKEVGFTSTQASYGGKGVVIALEDDSEEEKDLFIPAPRVGGAGIGAEGYDSNPDYSGPGHHDVSDDTTDYSYLDNNAGPSMYPPQFSSPRGHHRMAAPDVGVLAQQQPFPPHEEASSFYSISSYEDSASLLRYQDRIYSAGFTPSPRYGLRLYLDEYLHDTGFEHPRQVQYRIQKILRYSSWSYQVYDHDKSIQEHWATSNKHMYLIKGLPLVEDVPFLVNTNFTSPNGDCYWRALSFSLYGSDGHWTLVKAEHLEYLNMVLSSPEHPRHELYSETLNKKFYQSSSGPGGAPFMANLWQLLHMPHAWTPGAMQQITADLYNIHLVTFSYDPERRRQGDASCTEVNVRGAYNAQHVFMLYVNNNHFQPMTPNEHFGWEFRYPRITVESTAKFSNAPKPGSRRVDSSRKHPWRWEHTREVLPPVPRVHGCDVETLRDLMDDRQER